MWLLFRPQRVGRGWEREKKNYRSDKFLLDEEYKIQKNSKKIQKIQKILMAFFQAKMGGERLRKREKKIIIPINSYPAGNRKLKKKKQKN